MRNIGVRIPLAASATMSRRRAHHQTCESQGQRPGQALLLLVMEKVKKARPRKWKRPIQPCGRSPRAKSRDASVLLICIPTRTRPAPLYSSRRWKSVAALEAHLKQAHTQAFLKTLPECRAARRNSKITLARGSGPMETISWPMLGASRRSGKHILLRGWVRTRAIRRAASSFIELNDGSCQATCKLLRRRPGNYESEIRSYPPGPSVAIEARSKRSPANGQPTGGYAIKVMSLRLADPETFPLPKKGHTFEFLRMIAHFAAADQIRRRDCPAPQPSLQVDPRFFTNRAFCMFPRRCNYLPPVDCEEPKRAVSYTIDPDKPPLSLPKPCLGETGKPVRSITPRTFFGKPAFPSRSAPVAGEAFACALGKIYTLVHFARELQHAAPPRRVFG